MANGLDITAIPFLLRGASGTVSVEYGVNEDPVRWGWAVLGLEWFSPELVRGFPIVQATVDHPAEGYAAAMGWLQVVRYDVRDPGEEEQVTVFDVPPQLAETDTPYAAFGVRPTFFDAPAMGAKDATWACRHLPRLHARRSVEPGHPADLRVLMGLPAPRRRRCSWIHSASPMRATGEGTCLTCESGSLRGPSRTASVSRAKSEGQDHSCLPPRCTLSSGNLDAGGKGECSGESDPARRAGDEGSSSISGDVGEEAAG